MTDKEVAASVEALLTGRPAKPFQASAEEAEILRTAIAVRAGHATGVAADPWFVENLHRDLAAGGGALRLSRGRCESPPLTLPYIGRSDAPPARRP